MKRRPGPRDRDDKRDDATDAEYFSRAMEGVRKIAPDPRGRVRPSTSLRTSAAPAVITPRREPEERTFRSALPQSTQSEDDDDDSASAFVTPGVDRRELRKLKRGDYAPGHRLDLHGMTSAEAMVSVTRLLEKSRGLHRCVCVVHGRGLHSGGNVAILKTKVRAFLRQHQAVLAYADAPRTDGGPGAVYVLLRK